MNWRDIRTEHDARRVAAASGFALFKHEGAWFANGHGRCYYGGRPQYAARSWLRFQQEGVA